MGLYKRGSVWWMSFTCQAKRYLKSTETDDRKLAKRIYEKIRYEVAQGKWFPEEKNEDEITFKQLTEKYMEEHSKVKKRSWNRDELSLAHLLPSFGELPLTEITPEVISRYKVERLKKGKPATLNRELALAKHAFNLAWKEWGLVHDNPFCKVKLEKENNERSRVLGYDEEEWLMSICPGWLGEIVIFALNTGCRMGEITSLTWKDVDLFRKVIAVRQEKTGHNKTIPLSNKVFDVLKERAKVRHLKCDLVFPSKSLTRIDSKNLSRDFKKVVKKAKIDDFRFHDLRHTFASRLAQREVDIYLIQKLLGHRDPRMVRRYSHHSVESLRAGIGVLDRPIPKSEEKVLQNCYNEAGI